MQTSLRALASDILDYAGLFPPAELGLDEAIHNYARHVRQPEAWMLARFVCPASRLGELEPYVDELFSSGPPLRLCVLGRSGATSAQFLEALGRVVKDIADFLAHCGKRAGVQVFEVRFPDGLAEEADVSGLLENVVQVWDVQQMARPPIFYEPPAKADWQTTWPAIIRGIAHYCQEAGSDIGVKSNPNSVGFKLRCGGKEASAFPSIEKVAAVIQWACTAGVPLKFTAGLHQPLRHYDEAAQVNMHGFVNVFAAGILAASDKVNQEDLGRILACEKIDSFEFSPDGMCVEGFHVTCDQIASVRREAVTSFGSCSVEEPLDGLRKLGLL